jgi:hypothetical protein
MFTGESGGVSDVFGLNAVLFLTYEYEVVQR